MEMLNTAHYSVHLLLLIITSTLQCKFENKKKKKQLNGFSVRRLNNVTNTIILFHLNWTCLRIFYKKNKNKRYCLNVGSTHGEKYVIDVGLGVIAYYE